MGAHHMGHSHPYAQSQFAQHPHGHMHPQHQQILTSHPQHQAITPTSHPALNRFLLPSQEYVSCVLWNGLYHITGTDIVRALVFRFEVGFLSSVIRGCLSTFLRRDGRWGKGTREERRPEERRGEPGSEPRASHLVLSALIPVPSPRLLRTFSPSFPSPSPLLPTFFFSPFPPPLSHSLLPYPILTLVSHPPPSPFFPASHPLPSPLLLLSLSSAPPKKTHTHPAHRPSPAPCAT
jgi:hypothetical protein